METLARSSGATLVVTAPLEVFSSRRSRGTLRLTPGTAVTLEAVADYPERPRALIDYHGIPIVVSGELAARHLSPLPEGAA